MNRNVYVLIAVLLALLLSLCGCGLEGERSERFDTGGARLTRVERVVDGDTVILAAPGLGPSSRLVGMLSRVSRPTLHLPAVAGE